MKLKYYSYNQRSDSTINIDSGIEKSYLTEPITINEETIVASFFNLFALHEIICMLSTE